MAVHSSGSDSTNDAMQTCPPWPPGNSETAGIVRRTDWSRTSLGPSDQWPAALRTAVSAVLDSQLPMILLWGPRFVQIYNDGYRAILGDQHPTAMGLPQAETSSETWQANQSLYRSVVDDQQSLCVEDQPFPAAPPATPGAADTPAAHGAERIRYQTVCCSPVRDPAGDVQGVLLTLIDTTRRVRAEHRTEHLLTRGGVVLNHLSKLFEQAPGFAAVLRGSDHVIEMANDAFHQLVGRRVLVERPLLEAVAEFEEMGFRELLDGALKTGRPFVGRSMRTVLRHPGDADPAEVFIDFVFQPLIEADGLITGVFVQGHDVSERRQAENALRERNQRLAVLYDTARAMLATEQPTDFLDQIYDRLADLLGLDVYLHHSCSADGRFLHLSAHRGLTAEQVVRLTQWPLGETVHGQVAQDRMPVVVDDVRHSTDARMETIRSLGLRAFACEPLIARGRLVGTLSLGSTVRAELDDNTLGTLRAIGQLVAVAIERQRTRQALRDSEERFRSVFSHPAVGIAITDADGRFLHANDAFCTLVGRSERLLRDTTFGALTHPEDRERELAAVRQVLAGAMPSALVHTRYLGAGDRVVWVQASVAAVHDELGRPQSLIWLVEDVSERMQAEMQLARADRTRSEFLAMLAHELRNPMAPLRNAIALMERGDAAGRYTKPLVAIMHRQIDQLSRLVGDLLEVSRINQGKIELRIAPMQLSQAVELAIEAVQPLADERDQTLVLDPPQVGIGLKADACRIAQVLTNLLHNAIKFTPAGGRIELLVAERPPGRVEIAVRDNGVGIAPELLPYVFELFEQGQQTLDRSQGGLGIGLALVRQLVRMHGGSVSAHSDGAGRGATFIVTLPLEPG